MKPRRFSLRVQMVVQYALVTLVTGLAFITVNFGFVERNADGLADSILGLGVITLVAIAAGQAIARNALRPLRAVTAKAQRVSAASLHQRIDLVGPDDELQQLATTIDALLARLEGSFERERRFVANASHEIRTPLAVTRAALELGLNMDDPSVEDLRSVISQALHATTRSETMAADLLLLARSESVGLGGCEQFDLAELTGGVIDDLARPTAATEVDISADLSPAPMWGNVGLVDRLIANLIDNAVRHNAPTKWIKVDTKAVGDQALLMVQNHMSTTLEEPLEELFEPFRRGAQTSTKPAGHGLGLSIVRAIAVGHRARCEASQSGNVFQIKICFGPPDASEQETTFQPFVSP